VTGESLYPRDLIERLRLVLDEREKTARAAIQGPWYTSTRNHLSPYVVYGVSPLGGDRIVQVCNIEAAWQRHENAAFMVANGPDVALRTIQAHRKILDEVLSWRHAWVEDCWYSCGLAIDPSFPDEEPGSGCCNDNTARECTCGLDARRELTLGALASIYFPESDE
jgi:hypothetical protein